MALKCLGLAAWMVRSGLPLPVLADSSVGWFDPVLVDVGDEQSLERSLSTFSAHVTNLSAILGMAARHTLVLLDEVVAGTDPEEGAALATAVLETLVERGVAVAVTTHYERLKERAYRDSRFVNASVGFDFTRMAPTFRLALGVPGPSSALMVAARFGIPHAVLERAQAHLPDESVAREDLVQSLAAEREQVVSERAELEAERARQAELTRELEAERQTVRAQERERLGREAARAHGTSARGESRAPNGHQPPPAAGFAEGRARRAWSGHQPRGRQVSVGSELVNSSRREPEPRGGRLTEADLAPGARAYLPRLATLVELVEPPVRGQVRVRAGAMKLLVGMDELAPVSADTVAPPSRSQAAPAESSERDGERVRARADSQQHARSARRTCGGGTRPGGRFLGPADPRGGCGGFRCSTVTARVGSRRPCASTSAGRATSSVRIRPIRTTAGTPSPCSGSRAEGSCRMAGG